MKKLLTTFCTFCLCLILSGCTTGFAPLPLNASDNTVNTKRITTRHRSPNKNDSQSTMRGSQISVNDFSDLSLNNYQPTQGNLWEEIAKGLQVPDQENRPEVQAQIRWFMNHPGYLQRTTERARPYFYIVYQEVQSRHLPTELVLLPINESAYYPFNYSSAGATGIWQLMPGTASDFGLKHNFWYDGRRDIFDSTNAALDYLTYLAHYFNGDWLLAIAAYDTGEGNVERAIARNTRAGLPTDFWSLHLASETRSYVPRLLALATIVAHPDRYPVALPPVDAKAVVAPVHLASQIKLADAARLAGISINQLKILNPGLSHTATDPSGDSKLLLPIDTIASFKENLSSFSPSSSAEPSVTNFGHYRVQRGDTLASIAARFGMSVDDLRNANKLLGRYVSPGKVLLIPNVADHYKPSTQINLDETNLALDTQTTASTENFNTTNRKQDLAQRLNTMNRNNQPITLTNQEPQDNQDSSNAENNTPPPTSAMPLKAIPSKHVIKHKVTHGETLSSISRRYHVSLQQLQSLNPGIRNRPLRPGMVIIIQTMNAPLAVTPTSQVSTSKKVIHKNNAQRTGHKKKRKKAAP